MALLEALRVAAMIEEIAPQEFRLRCATSELWQLLDVREDWELQTAAVEGTINIPMAAIPTRLAELDAARPVAVMCHSGVRSRRVAEFLKENGFEQVANVTGGIDAWSLTVDTSVPRY